MKSRIGRLEIWRIDFKRRRQLSRVGLFGLFWILLLFFLPLSLQQLLLGVHLELGKSCLGQNGWQFVARDVARRQRRHQKKPRINVGEHITRYINLPEPGQDMDGLEEGRENVVGQTAAVQVDDLDLGTVLREKRDEHLHLA